MEPGVDLLIGLEAISDADERGFRTVMCTLNGQLRPVAVRDRSFDATVEKVRKADANDPTHLGAPFGGVVVLSVGVGDDVAAGDPVGTIEAMKMESTITAPRSGVIAALPLGKTAQVDGGDLIVEFG